MIIAPYDPVWSEKFKQEAKVWHSVLAGIPHQVHHVGSTSVPGLAAKPIIDILIEVEDLALLDVKRKEIEGLGYEIKGEYGVLKQQIAERMGNDRRAYSAAKNDFIQEQEMRALEWWGVN